MTMILHPDEYKSYKTWSRRDIPDCLWPTDNHFDIPTLRADLQGNAVDVPVTGWGTVRRTTMMPGTWHFYVDDYRFNKLWTDPSPSPANTLLFSPI